MFSGMFSAKGDDETVDSIERREVLYFTSSVNEEYKLFRKVWMGKRKFCHLYDTGRN